ncbi:HU family DNA-binding protein [Actinomadura macrotermitis]|uniref:Integration host factor subunit beta n=1 Tax=Actinomadura macrotermitis TaxID=2585200 RepID=A0A7K0C8D0_9ACTN|nr:HU family DNA-binding protein [Actinomadura macrotermitis]MQY09729.1 Integration host factor subunit beta [Actinomadura macrotermitis]
MNRTELIEAVAARAGSDHAAARRHVDAVFEAIMENVAAGERVLVTGFGTFDRQSRPARTARNPRTGLPIEVPAAEVPRFRIGQTFKNRVAQQNGAAAEEEAPEAPAEIAGSPAKPKKGKKKAEAKKPEKKSEKKAAKPAKAVVEKAVEKPVKKAAKGKAKKPAKK